MPVSRKRNPGYLLACGLIVTGLFFFLMSRSADAASGNSAYPAADKAEVEAKLRAKGKTPWIEREKGMGVMTLKSGGEEKWRGGQETPQAGSCPAERSGGRADACQGVTQPESIFTAAEGRSRQKTE